MDLKWRYKYVDITCSHFGEHKSRSEGHRPNQKVNANEWPFRVRVVFKPAAEKFIVMKCETRHGPLPPKVPHPISAEHYALYRRNAYVMVNYIINRINGLIYVCLTVSWKVCSQAFCLIVPFCKCKPNRRTNGAAKELRDCHESEGSAKYKTIYDR